MARAALAATLAALLVAAPAAARVAPSADLADIEDEVMCVVCGVPLDQATEAPQAQRERAFILRLRRQGQTKQEIKDALVDEYGSEVLAVPGDSGFDLAAWIVPGAAVLLAAIAIGLALRRWRRSGSPDPPGADGGEPPLSPADSERLDADLARYEL
jgi:cytochrome c-type biogenesis protein CcmH